MAKIAPSGAGLEVLLGPALRQGAPHVGAFPNFTPESSTAWVPDLFAGYYFLRPANGPGSMLANF